MSNYKELVIDASVARAAGDSSQFPASRLCGAFLNELLNSNNKLVMTPDLHKEWDKHQSNLSRKIRHSLISKNRIKFIKNHKIQKLRTGILVLSDKTRIQAILKDIHLVEGALLSNQIVVSNDKRIKNHLLEIISDFGYLKLLTWVNPANEYESPIAWLKGGAQSEETRKLGFSPNKKEFDKINLDELLSDLFTEVN